MPSLMSKDQCPELNVRKREETSMPTPRHKCINECNKILRSQKVGGLFWLSFGGSSSQSADFTVWG